jgi:GT2 family glycosyltransferase
VKLGIVVVTYNAWNYLEKCLTSIADEIRDLHGAETIVIDNASSDETSSLIRQQFPWVRIVSNPANYGPARAFNQGVSLARALNCGLVLLANSDVVFAPGSIKGMYDHLIASSSVDGVCVGLYNPDGTRQKFRTSLGLSLRRFDWRRRQRIFFFGTGCHMMRISCFEKAGLYDENYYFYNEDLDWSIRAARKGLYFEYIPNRTVYHWGGIGRKQNRFHINADLPRSNVYFYYKNFGKFIGTLALIVIGSSLLLNLMVLNVLRLFSRGNISQELNMQKAAMTKLQKSIGQGNSGSLGA